jgi:hypothetical protein
MMEQSDQDLEDRSTSSISRDISQVEKEAGNVGNVTNNNKDEEEIASIGEIISEFASDIGSKLTDCIHSITNKDDDDDGGGNNDGDGGEGGDTSAKLELEVVEVEQSSRQEIPDAIQDPLSLNVLDEFLSEVSNSFNMVFEGAPPLPNPIPLGYFKYKKRALCLNDEITVLEEFVSFYRECMIYLMPDKTPKEVELKEKAQKIMDNELVVISEEPYRIISGEKGKEEAEAAAPVFFLEPIVHARSIRVINRLRLIYLKSREYSALHYLLHFQIGYWFTISKIVGFLFMIIASLICLATADESSVTGAAVLAILVSTINSWVQFTRLEMRTEGHGHAAAKFKKIAGLISNRLASSSKEMAERLAMDCEGVDDKPLVFKARSEAFLELVEAVVAWFKRTILPYFIKDFKERNFVMENILNIREAITGTPYSAKTITAEGKITPEYQDIIIHVANLTKAMYVDRLPGLREDVLRNTRYLLNPTHKEVTIVRDLLAPKFISLLPEKHLLHFKHMKILLHPDLVDNNVDEGEFKGGRASMIIPDRMSMTRRGSAGSTLNPLILESKFNSGDNIMSFIANNTYATEMVKTNVMRKIPQAMNKVIRVASKVVKNPRFNKVWIAGNNASGDEDGDGYNDSTGPNGAGMSPVQQQTFIKYALEYNKYDVDAEWQRNMVAAVVRYSNIKDKLNQFKFESEVLPENDPEKSLPQVIKTLLEDLSVPLAVERAISSKDDEEWAQRLESMEQDENVRISNNPVVFYLSQANSLLKAMNFARFRADGVLSSNKKKAEVIKMKCDSFEKAVNLFVHFGVMKDATIDIDTKIDRYGIAEKVLMTLIDFSLVKNLYRKYTEDRIEPDRELARVLGPEVITFVEKMHNEVDIFDYVRGYGKIPDVPPLQEDSPREHDLRDRVVESTDYLFKPLRALRFLWSPRVKDNNNDNNSHNYTHINEEKKETTNPGIHLWFRNNSRQIGSLIDDIKDFEHDKQVNYVHSVDVLKQIIEKASIENELEPIFNSRPSKDILHPMVMGFKDIEGIKKGLRERVFTVNDDKGIEAYNKLTQIMGLNPFIMDLLGKPDEALVFIRTTPKNQEIFDKNRQERNIGGSFGTLLKTLGISEDSFIKNPPGGIENRIALSEIQLTNEMIVEHFINTIEYLGIRQMMQQILQYDTEILPETVEALKKTDDFVKLLQDKDAVLMTPEVETSSNKNKNKGKQGDKDNKKNGWLGGLVSKTNKNVVDDKALESELRDLYSQYAPEKVKEIPKIMNTFKGREEILLEELHHKYKVKDIHRRRLSVINRNALPSSIQGNLVDPEAFRAELKDLYSSYNPEKLKEIPKIMETFKGREELLLDELHSKYGVKDSHRRRLSVINREAFSTVSGNTSSNSSSTSSKDKGDELSKISDDIRELTNEKYEVEEELRKIVDEMHQKQTRARLLEKHGKRNDAKAIRTDIEYLRSRKNDQDTILNDVVADIKELSVSRNQLVQGHHIYTNFKNVLSIPGVLINMMMEEKVASKEGTIYKNVKRKVKLYCHCEDPMDLFKAIMYSVKKRTIRAEQLHILLNATMTMLPPDTVATMESYQILMSNPAILDILDVDDIYESATKLYHYIFTEKLVTVEILKKITDFIYSDLDTQGKMILSMHSIFWEYFDEKTLRSPQRVISKMTKVFEETYRNLDDVLVLQDIFDSLKKVKVPIDVLYAVGGDELVSLYRRPEEHSIIYKNAKAGDMNIMADPLMALNMLANKAQAQLEEASEKLFEGTEVVEEDGDIDEEHDDDDHDMASVRTSTKSHRSKSGKSMSADEENTMAANEKLQLMLRYCTEYSFAHLLFSDYNKKLNEIQAFFTLLLAACTSLAIFAGGNPTMGGLLALATAGNDLCHRLYDTAGAMHTNLNHSRKYLKLKAEIQFLLLCCDAKAQETNYQDIATQYYNLKQTAPFLPPSPLIAKFFKMKDLAGLDENLAYFDDFIPDFIMKWYDPTYVDRKAKPYFEIIDKDPWEFMMYLDYLPSMFSRFRSTIGILFTILDKMDEFYYTSTGNAIFARQPPRTGGPTPTTTSNIPSMSSSTSNPMTSDLHTSSTTKKPSTTMSALHSLSKTMDALSPLDAQRKSLNVRRGSMARMSLQGMRVSTYTPGVDGQADIDLGTETMSEEQALMEQLILDTLHLKKTIDQSNRGRMHLMDLPETIVTIQADYESAVAAMPSLPSLLPTRFIYIGVRDQLDEVKVISPLRDDLTRPKGNLFERPEFQRTSTERQTSALFRLYCKCMEYRDVHKLISYKLDASFLSLQLTALAISLLVTIILLANTTNSAVMFCGVMAAIVSAIVSWTKFADYEATAANHKAASSRFENLTTDIESVFVAIRQLTEEFDPSSILETFDEVIHDYEDPNYGDAVRDGDGRDSDDDDDDGPSSTFVGGMGADDAILDSEDFNANLEDVDEEGSDSGSITSRESDRMSDMSEFDSDRESTDTVGNNAFSLQRRKERAIKRMKSPYTKAKNAVLKIKMKLEKNAEAAKEKAKNAAEEASKQAIAASKAAATQAAKVSAAAAQSTKEAAERAAVNAKAKYEESRKDSRKASGTSTVVEEEGEHE